MNMTSRASRKKHKPWFIGLTGGIATGKSTVSGILREMGAHVICADQVARSVVEPGTDALAEIVAHFGDDVLTADGCLDRAKLGALVFSDPAAREQLEHIVHPRIRESVTREAERVHAASPEQFVVYDAPLLIEASAHREVDRIIVVDVDPAIQIARLADREGMGREAAQARIDAQLGREERLGYADYVVDGSWPETQTRAYLEEVLMGLSRERERS